MIFTRNRRQFHDPRKVEDPLIGRGERTDELGRRGNRRFGQWGAIYCDQYAQGMRGLDQPILGAGERRGTISTGTGLCLATLCATLPSAQRFKPVLPWLHMTTRSARWSPSFPANLRMAGAGSPGRACVSVLMSASCADCATSAR